MPEPTPAPRRKRGYNVWFGLQHVTLTGFRHSGRRERCPKCNPAPSAPRDQPASPDRDAGRDEPQQGG